MDVITCDKFFSNQLRDVDFVGLKTDMEDLPPSLSGLAISGRGAVKAWLVIRQGVGSYPTPAGMSCQVSA